MRKINLFLFLMAAVLTAALFPQEEQEPKIKKTYYLEKALVYQDKILLIGETDWNCSPFIRQKIYKSIYITGGENMDWGKKDYSDGDRMYINRGTLDGVQEGDELMVIGEEQLAINGVTGETMGYYYLRKARAKVTCVYEDKAIITLDKGCNPVNIGDLVEPFEPRGKVMGKKLVYTQCRLPASPIEGNVAYSINVSEPQVITSPGNYVISDLGKAMVSIGDWMLIYKILGDGLPPLIVGSAYVINVENNSSTVKIIEATAPVEVGCKLVLLEDELVKALTAGEPGDENLPLIEGGRTKTASAPGVKKQMLELEMLFDIDSKKIKDIYNTEIETISGFITANPNYKVILRGYCCSIGGFEYNLKLSAQRVEQVKKYLMEKLGIKEEAFETYHYGEKDAPYDNTTEEQRRKNRLVLVQVIEL
jgi:outer membrane protein OmpA-like peptidoglycan-associated protein